MNTNTQGEFQICISVPLKQACWFYYYKANFHKEVFEQCDYHRRLKYCFLYCKGFSRYCDDRLQNWGSGVKNGAFFRLHVCSYQKQSPEVKKKKFLKNFAKFTGKYLCQSLFLMKIY